MEWLCGTQKRGLEDGERRGVQWWAGAEDTSDGGQTLESMPVGLMQIDHDWIVRYLNAEAEATIGWSREDLVGTDYWTAFPANVDNEFGRAYRRAVETGAPVVVEAFYPEPLNQWFEVRAVPTPHGLWLYFTEVTARRQAQERLAVIARVSETLAAGIDAPTAATRVPSLLVPALASWAALELVDETGTPQPAGYHHADPDRLPLLRAFVEADTRARPATSPLTRAQHAEGAVTVPGTDLTADRLHLVAAGEARDLLEQLDPGAVTVHPLRAQGHLLGTLTVAHARGRTVDALDRAATAEVAARTALALDNARLYRQQLQLAAELQRHMLTPPPEPDHSEVVVRYLPAAEAARVGGDWYDVFLQPGGATTVVVGDVVGHDTAAAAVMGQLRAMLRGLGAVADTGPAELLSQLDRVLPQLQLHAYATVAVARFEQTPEEIAAGTTRVRWSSAGHLPPVVIRPDGTLEDAGPWRGELMIGVDHTVARTERELTVQRGATVVFFTDGLLERRDRDLDTGLHELRAALAELADRPLPDLCDQLLDRMLATAPDDDVALVAVRLHRQDRPRPTGAGPTDVPDTVPPDPASA